MHSISHNSFLIHKLKFISNFSRRIQITPDSIKSVYVHVMILELSTCSFSCNVFDLLEMLSFTNKFELLNDKKVRSTKIGNSKLKYSYFENINGLNVKTTKEFPVFEDDFSFTVSESFLSISVKNLQILSEDILEMEYSDGKLSLTSFGYIQTKFTTNAEVIEGDKNKVKVDGKKLKNFEEFFENIIISFCEDCLLINKFEESITTAIIINLIN